MRFTFRERQPVRWLGRYRRIEGTEPVFHVRANDTVDILRRDSRDEIRYPAVMAASLTKLARSVNAIKRRYTGNPGGAFIINEFGQVLCPVAASPWDRYYVGDCSGAPVFRDLDGKQFTLEDIEGLAPGDIWDRPYVGTAYNLSARNQIYFPFKKDVDTEFINPPRQDRTLIKAIRNLRPSGGVRFIVNPHGLVLTKVPHGQTWEPRFVGKINYDLWFRRENG